MFISKSEKEQMHSQIASLQAAITDANIKIARLHRIIGSLMVRIEGDSQSVEARKGRGWSIEQRDAQSDRMKRVWADKKEARA